MYRMHSIVNHA